MGGAIATLFSHKYPTLVNRLILLTPAGLPWPLPFGSSLLSIPYLGWVMFCLVTTFVLTLEKSIGENFFDIKYSQKSIKQQLELRIKGGLTHYIDYMTNSVANFPLTRCVKEATNVGKHSRPTLIVWGQYDTTTPSDVCFPQWHNLFKNNKDCTFVVVKDVRHNFFNEEVELSNKVITSWILGQDFNYNPIKHSNIGAIDIKLDERDIEIKRFWNENEHLFGTYMI
ncbi:1 TM domain-containing transmembrane protein [Acrasis kona]|uniref:1 TM domain-containing transmembrane protein n=1 Tax=Acrasis kona TaxID=1008807 RepID=A0AAW2ZA48_9EUKA